MKTIERVGVVGCGLMGSGIAEVSARAGLGLPGPQTSTASLVKVQGKWVLQGPVAAFGKLLGTSGKAKLHRPIRSDS